MSMKSTLLGQAFMLPSYALIVAGIVNSQDMTAFLVLMGLSLVSTTLAIAVGYHWTHRNKPKYGGCNE